jgi:hypothetical protein
MTFQQTGKLYHLFWDYRNLSPRIYKQIEVGEKSYFPLPQARLGNSLVSVVRGMQIPSLIKGHEKSEYYFLIYKPIKHE